MDWKWGYRHKKTATTHSGWERSYKSYGASKEQDGEQGIPNSTLIQTLIRPRQV